MEAFETPFIAITDAIASHAKWRPGKTALVCDDQRRTWAEFSDAVTRVANGLVNAELQRGEKVSLLMTNSIEMLEIMMGTVKAGGVIVPLSVMLTAESLATMINDSDSRFVFADARFTRTIDSVRRDLINMLPDGLFVVGDETEGWINYQSWRDGAGDEPAGVRLTPDDDFNLIYSSGTTGAPKGIAHTHYARQQSAYILAIEFHKKPEETTAAVWKDEAGHTYLRTGDIGKLDDDRSSKAVFGRRMNCASSVPISLVSFPQKGSDFNPNEFLTIVERERCTHTFMVPTQYIVTMEVPEFDRFDLSSLKVLLSAGAPLRADTKTQMLQRFGGGVFELYGLTEGIATTLKPEEMEGKLSSVGTTVFGGDIRIIDDAGSEVPRGEAGEIVGYSSALMSGYWFPLHPRPEERHDPVRWRQRVSERH